MTNPRDVGNGSELFQLAKDIVNIQTQAYKAGSQVGTRDAFAQVARHKELEYAIASRDLVRHLELQLMGLFSESMVGNDYRDEIREVATSLNRLHLALCKRVADGWGRYDNG